VRRAGPRAAVGALHMATSLLQDGRSREAWVLLRAAAEARPGGGDDASQLDPNFIKQVTRMAIHMVCAGPWVTLAAQPLVSRWLHGVRRLPG
jgi:hypothetical protein